MAEVIATIRGWGVGFIVALIVLIICVILMFLGAPLTPFQVLGLMAALAVARLL